MLAIVDSATLLATSDRAISAFWESAAAATAAGITSAAKRQRTERFFLSPKALPAAHGAASSSSAAASGDALSALGGAMPPLAVLAAADAPALPGGDFASNYVEWLKWVDDYEAPGEYIWALQGRRGAAVALALSRELLPLSVSFRLVAKSSTPATVLAAMSADDAPLYQFAPTHIVIIPRLPEEMREPRPDHAKTIDYSAVGPAVSSSRQRRRRRDQAAVCARSESRVCLARSDAAPHEARRCHGTAAVGRDDGHRDGAIALAENGECVFKL